MLFYSGYDPTLILRSARASLLDAINHGNEELQTLIERMNKLTQRQIQRQGELAQINQAIEKLKADA